MKLVYDLVSHSFDLQAFVLRNERASVGYYEYQGFVAYGCKGLLTIFDSVILMV